MASLLLLVVGVYWPSFQFDFVNWDDPWYVINNPLIRSWHPLNLFKIATEFVALNYAPITISSFLVDRTLWGLWPGGYHLTNVLLHSVNAVLVYRLIERLTRRSTNCDGRSDKMSALTPDVPATNRLWRLSRSSTNRTNRIGKFDSSNSTNRLEWLSRSKFIGWTTAAVFALHPVHIESVAWISSRKGLLSAVFILATLNCWLRTKRTAKHELTGLCFFVLALLSKAIAVVVPVVVLLYDMLLSHRDGAVEGPLCLNDRDSKNPTTNGSEPPGIGRAFVHSLSRQFVPGLLSVWLLLITMSAQTTQLGGVRSHLDLSKLEILAVDSVILWRYVFMLICPTELCVLYDPATTGIAAAVVLSILGWLCVAGAVIRWHKRFPSVTFAILSSFVLLVPVLNLFPITTLMNDRYLYLPSIPLMALATTAAHTLFRKTWRSVGQVADHNLVKRPDCSYSFGHGVRSTGALSARAALNHGASKNKVVVPLAAIGCFMEERIRPFCQALMWGLAIASVLLFANLTRQHLPVWRNSFTLWRHTLQHVPHLPVVQIQWANTLHDEGRNREARSVLSNTLAYHQPDEADRVRILRKLEEWK